jgi:transcription elongation factor Elf1
LHFETQHFSIFWLAFRKKALAAMGKKKRASTDRHKIRMTKPPEKRDTLLPCPACGGERQRPAQSEESNDTNYAIRFVDCKWCDGNGVVEVGIRKMFRRWIRIYACNIAAGRCQRKSGRIHPSALPKITK